MIGKTLGHYQITEKLGAGGMGIVCKARDTHLDRFAALKVLPPEKVLDPERKRRFIQEAKAASALDHPSIITIYGIDQADGKHIDTRSDIFASHSIFESGLWRMSVSGSGDPKPLFAGRDRDSRPAVSRQGNRLVFVSVSVADCTENGANGRSTWPPEESI